MSELISIREAARRLGVSDTAVHKAIDAGRTSIAARKPGSNRPLVAWPQIQTDWQANSDVSRRTHVGSKTPKAAKAPAARSPAPAPVPAVEVQPPTAGAAGTSFAASRAVRETYQARLAKLEFEQKSGKLVEVDQIKVRAFKLARSARDQLLTMPDRLAPILASETDVLEVHRLLTEDIERTCERIAAEAASIA